MKLSVIEGMIIASVVVILVLGIYALAGFGSDSSKTEHADRGVLPGTVNIVCIEGYEYLYVQSCFEGYARAVMAPKFNDAGKPAKCRVEK